MNSIYLVLFAFTSFFLGYKFYSKYISSRIFELDGNDPTPAHKNKDGIDDRMDFLIENNKDLSVIVILHTKPTKIHIEQIENIGLEINN